MEEDRPTGLSRETFDPGAATSHGSGSTAPGRQPEAGQALSHYRLIDKIGEGGMGVVWKAADTVLGRTVAIKVLPDSVSRDGKRREMFLQEARLASSVSAAHVAQVYEFGREGDLDFIAMEYDSPLVPAGQRPTRAGRAVPARRQCGGVDPPVRASGNPLHL